MVLQNFDVRKFLDEYWQQKPLVIRNAFSDPFWLEANDLAGLACEPDVESRLIMAQESEWTVKKGPFDDAEFSKLPETDWTLLVQAVDQWIPEVRDVLGAFRFLPQWRLDDIMVSYAPIGGTVSQHYDFFDVFLIQGEGTRRWQVGDVCGSHSPLVPNTPVRILEAFSPLMEVELSPGDMLYIPAKHSHFGVSIENSITYSVGFRAPGIREMVDGIATTALENLLEDDRYRDCAASLKAPTGAIPAAAIDQVRLALTQALLDDQTIADWFGRYVTERKYPDLELLASSPDAWQSRLENGACLERNAASRFAYVVTAERNQAMLYVDGHAFAVTTVLAEALCDGVDIDSKAVLEQTGEPGFADVVSQLIESGALLFMGDFD
ncbi:MAG: cupin domain-containing protein [Pseudomonadales bacterium]|nr:cupin domain-containing protein [Pseudomonadales bacterium]